MSINNDMFDVCSVKTSLNISVVLLFLFLAAHFIACFPLFDGNVGNTIKIIPGLLSFGYAFKICERTVLRNGIVIVGILSIAMLSSMAYNHNSSMRHVLWFFSYMGVAIILYSFALSDSILRFFIGIVVFVLMLCMLISHHATDVLGHGVNGLSAFLVFLIFIYLLTLVRKEIVWPLYWPSLLLAITSIWTANRSGILCALVLFAGTLFLSIKLKRNLTLSLYLVIPLFLFIIFFYGSLNAFDYSVLSRKMNDGFLYSSRTMIWGEYVKASLDNVWNFMFGPSRDNLKYELMHHYNGNVHNVFFLLHSRCGVFGLGFMLLLLIKSLFMMLRNKNWYLLLLLFFVSLRGMFDWIAFPGLFDVAFFFYAIYTLDVNRYAKLR